MKRYLTVATIVVLLCVFPGMGFTGTITGTAKFRNRNNRGGILVFLEKVGNNKFEPPKEHAIMDQLSLVFIPFMLPVVLGTTVDYLNSDPVLHNVFTPDEVADKFNLGTWPRDKIRSHTFNKIGSAVMLCNVHPEMEAYVVALPNPYFAVTAVDGNFTIPSKPNPKEKRDKRPAPPELPAGKYILHAWHPKAELHTEEVTVAKRGTSTVEIVLERGRAQNVSAIYKANR
ncbi:MAG: hypothetical protein ACE5PV_21925 [Candidatus Poribacteria bacterium]